MSDGPEPSTAPARGRAAGDGAELRSGRAADGRALAPRTRLSTRVTVFFFVMSAVPAIVVMAVAVMVLDRLISDEISGRTFEVTSSVKRLVESELRRASRGLERFASSEELRRTVLEPLEHGAVPDGAELDALLADHMRASGLELLALVETRPGGEAVILASAHVPEALQAPAPRFARLSATATTAAGFARELEAGNPPEETPALVAVRAIRGRHGTLVAYGGVRLAPRLQATASSAYAWLVLDEPDAPRLSFPVDVKVPELDDPDASMRLPVLPADADGRAGRVLVRVDTRRLERARATFTAAAATLVVVWLLLAPLAGLLLSRPITAPIVELAEAAQKIGAGDLAVKLEPRSNDEVGALVGVFNEMTRELAESRARLQRAERVAAWREIARRVAHEIKNPLFPIQMSMETLRKSWRTQHPKLEEIVEESTKTVLEEVRSLNRIVTEFSDFARLPSPKLEETCVLDVLDHAAALWASGTTGAAAVEVGLDRAAIVARALPPIAIDRGQIERALINLVKNALEVLRDTGGRVTLDAHAEVRAGRSGVVLTVHDTGPGIPDELRERIFTPYFTTKAEGTGLGLAIVERIAEEHQGAVRVESAPGRGTTFRLWLPERAAQS